MLLTSVLRSNVEHNSPPSPLKSRLLTSPTDRSPGLTTGIHIKLNPLKKKEGKKGTAHYVSSANSKKKKRTTVLKPRAFPRYSVKNCLDKTYLFACLDSSEHGEERRDERSA